MAPQRVYCNRYQRHHFLYTHTKLIQLSTEAFVQHETRVMNRPELEFWAGKLPIYTRKTENNPSHTVFDWLVWLFVCFVFVVVVVVFVCFNRKYSGTQHKENRSLDIVWIFIKRSFNEEESPSIKTLGHKVRPGFCSVKIPCFLQSCCWSS